MNVWIDLLDLDERTRFSNSVLEVDSNTINSTKTSLTKKREEYYIWFVDNRLDFDAGVAVNLVGPDKSIWESTIFPESRTRESACIKMHSRQIHR